MFLSDYPRGLANCLCLCWLPVLDALPVAPALTIAFLLARRRFPVSLLGLPSRPLPRCLPAARAAISLAHLSRMKTLLASLEQTAPCARPSCLALSPPSRLLLRDRVGLSG